MKLKIALGVIALAGAIGLASAYVGFTIASDIGAVRAALSGGPADLSPPRMASVKARLDAVRRDLSSPVARALRALPVTGHNIRAVDDVAAATAGALDAGLELHTELDALSRAGVVAGGRVDLELLGRMAAPVRRQEAALAALAAELRVHRNGWVLPPLWNVLHDMLARVEPAAAAARRAGDALELAGPLLGAEGKRTYLVVLLNNAELRAAGGIPSAAGTLTARDGRLELGPFVHTSRLGGRPRRRVPAPEDFRRRFGQLGADTTLWVNTTFSPDVPDVALVASRLYRLEARTRIDGVVLADPRGIAALLPPDASVDVPGPPPPLSPAALPEFVYSDAYELYRGADQSLRRDALIAIGRHAFETFLTRGSLGRAGLERVWGAVSAGHLRIVAFDREAARLLRAADASGDLAPTAGDTLLVTAQNVGGDKLDFWARRSVSHSCRVAARAALCETEVTVRNDAPAGLPRYVAGPKRATLQSYLEIYVPERARVASFAVDGRAHTYFPDRQDGHTSLAVVADVARGSATTVSARYRMSLPGRYELTAIPQPLPHDARVRTCIAVPSSWTVRGPGGGEPHCVEGPFDSTIELSAAPRASTGLTGLWDRVVRFWTEPVL